MILVLTVTGLLLQISLFTFLDWKIWKTFFTPFIFLAIPFAVILLAGFLLTDLLGFYAIRFPVVVVWIIGLFAFWLPSPIFALIQLPLTKPIPFLNCNYSFTNNRVIFGILFSILIIVLITLGLSLMSAGIFSENFSSTIFYSSLLSHLKLFVRVFFILLLGSNYRFFGKTGKIILAILMLMVFTLSESKSWLFIPIITVFLLNATSVRKIKLISTKIVLLGVTLVFGVFYVVYYFSVGQLLSFADYNAFLITHIGKYFFAPVIAMSEYMVQNNELSINVVYPIISPVNFYNVITGNDIMPTNSDNWTYYFESGNSNVYTFFGDILINSGWIGLIIYSFIISSFYHLLLMISIQTRHFFANSVYFFLLTFLLFGWFGLFTPLLAFYEIPLIFLLCYIISRFRCKKTVKISI